MPASTSVPVAGAPVYLNGGSTAVATTNASGQFTYPVPGPPSNPSFTFSVAADANNLYSPASTPIVVSVTPGQTAMTITTNPASVNGGPQTVTFTVTLDVTPAGTGTTPEPIGACIAVDVSMNGGISALAGMTDSSGVLNYKIPGVRPGNDYNFTVANGTLYTAANEDFAFNKESTNLTVTPSETSVTEGSQNVTFSGTATGVVGSSSVPITGATVDLNNSSTPVATTDSAGNFSYTARGVSHAATYQFSIAGSPTYTPGSASVAIGLTAAPTRITFIKISPSALKYGQKATLQGAVQYKNGKTWAGFPRCAGLPGRGQGHPGQRRRQQDRELHREAAYYARLCLERQGKRGRADAAGNRRGEPDHRRADEGSDVQRGPVDGRVRAHQRVPGGDGAGQVRPDVQHSAAVRDQRPWQVAPARPASAHNFDRKAKGCASSNNSFFTGAMRAASDNAYYRVMFPATSSFQAAVSKVIHSSRTQTKITSFTFSPRTLKKGQLATMTGRLWRKVGPAWKEYGGRRIEIIYNEKGTSFWGNLGSVTTNSKGYFKQLADGGPGNFTVTAYAQYAGSSTDLAARSAGIAVAIKQSGSAVSSTAPPGVQQLPVMIAANGPQSFMLTEQSVLILGVAPEQIGGLEPPRASRRRLPAAGGRAANCSGRGQPGREVLPGEAARDRGHRVRHVVVIAEIDSRLHPVRSGHRQPGPHVAGVLIPELVAGRRRVRRPLHLPEPHHRRIRWPAECLGPAAQPEPVHSVAVVPVPVRVTDHRRPDGGQPQSGGRCPVPPLAVAGATCASVRGKLPRTRTSGVRFAQAAFMVFSPAGSAMNRSTRPLAQPKVSSSALMCTSLRIRIQRADGPISLAVCRPSNGVVSESRSPDRTRTGRVAAHRAAPSR